MAEQNQSQQATVAQEQAVQKSPPSQTPSPFDDMERFMEGMEHFFGDFLPRGWLRSRRGGWPGRELMAPLAGWSPQVDIIDRDEEILVRAAMPGVDKKDLEVSVNGNLVTLKGSTRREEKEEKGDYYRAELSQGAFTRTLALPAEVNADQAKARFQDGVLELTLPKQAPARRRTIQVE